MCLVNKLKKMLSGSRICNIISSIPKKTLVLATTLFVLNLFDAIATYIVLTSGMGYELNPLIQWVLDQSYFMFLSMKILLGAVVSIIFALTHTHKLSRIGLWATTVTYALLTLYYIICFIHMIFFL